MALPCLVAVSLRVCGSKLGLPPLSASLLQCNLSISPFCRWPIPWLGQSLGV